MGKFKTLSKNSPPFELMIFYKKSSEQKSNKLDNVLKMKKNLIGHLKYQK